MGQRARIYRLFIFVRTFFKYNYVTLVWLASDLTAKRLALTGRGGVMP